MKKQLLITTFAAFSGLAFAEAPTINHTEIAQNFMQKFATEAGQNCPRAKEELPTIQAILDRLSNGSATDEDKIYLEQLDAGYNIQHKLTIEDLTKKTTEASIDLSEAVGTEKTPE